MNNPALIFRNEVLRSKVGKISIQEKDESKRNRIGDDVINIRRSYRGREALEEEGGRKIQSEGLTVVEIRGSGA